MDDFIVCIACLNSDREMHSIRNTKLPEIYEKLANITLSSEGLPSTLCYICYSQLQRCYRFMNMSQRAAKILTQLLSDGFQLSQDTILRLNVGTKNSLVTTTLRPTSVPSSNDEFIAEKTDQVQPTEKIINTCDREVDVPENQILITLKQEPVEMDEQVVIDEPLVTVKEEPVEEVGSANEPDALATEKNNIVKKERENTIEFETSIKNHKDSKKNYPPEDHMVEEKDSHLVQVKRKYKKSGKKRNPQEKNHACDRCEMKFTCQAYLNRHIRTHTGERPYACKSCDKTFVQKPHLVQHMTSHTGEKPFVCNTCGNAFNRRNNFITHVKRHSELTFYLCNVCNKALSNKGDLKRHMLIHTGEKPFSCKICDKSFSQKGHLNEHVKLHTGVKTHPCNLCNKSFYRRPALNKHMLTHTKEHPHACTICNKKFPSTSKLKRHMSIHSGENNFTCNTCGMSFDDKNNYRAHIRKHIEVPHNCVVCNETLANKADLKRHMIIHPEHKPYSCTVCDVKFNENCHLAKHMKVHTPEKSYACNICEKTFIHKYHLKNHLLVHSGEKRFPCTVCFRKFSRKASLTNHFMRLHTAGIPYACGKCDKTFRQKSHLTEHIAMHDSDDKILQLDTGDTGLDSNVMPIAKEELNIQSLQPALMLLPNMPFVCNICNEAYREKYILEQHINAVHTRKDEEFIIP